MRLFSCIAIVLLLSSCALDARKANPLVEQPSAHSGLTEGRDGVQVKFSEPGVLRRYQAFYVEPISIYENDKGSLIKSSGREINDLANSFRSKIIRSLGSRHTNFNQPAREVAIIRVKLMDVWSTRALEALRPGLLIPNNLGGGATMEALFIDSVSQRPVGRVWDSRPGERQGYFSGLTKWGGTKAAFDDWAQLLKSSIREGAYS